MQQAGRVSVRQLLHAACVLVTVSAICHVHAQQQQQQDVQGELLFAHVLYRHGDRTPIDPYPTDPWRDRSHWTTGWGQLTNAGKLRHLQLGQWLRQRYSTILNDEYSNNDIYVRSTDVDRTLMSAQSNLAGLYPPKGADVWDTAIAWQPIPVHTMAEETDSVLAAKKPCSAFDHELKRYKNSDAYQTYNSSLASVYRYLTEKTERKVDSLTSAQNLYSCLHIEEMNNFTLPEWAHSVYPEPLATISANAFAVKTNTTLLARLKMGPLVREMLLRFKDKVKGALKPNRSVWVYSGHDITVAGLLNALGIFELHNPPFAACVLLELRKPTSGGEPFVQVFYKNTTAEPQLMDIPGCGTSCPLTKMFDIYDDILPLNWDRECEMSLLSMTYVEADLQSATSLIGVLFLVAIGILLLLTVLAVYRRRNGYYNDKWYLRIDG